MLTITALARLRVSNHRRFRGIGTREPLGEDRIDVSLVVK
jgi:hypothetical protein